MKKILILTIASLVICLHLHAQTEKGNHTLGLNLGFTSSNTSETLFNEFDSTYSVAKIKTTHFTFGPSYSYFIANKIDLGVSLQYNSGVENDYPVNGMFGEKEITHRYGASVFIRKYYLYQNKIGIRTGPYISYYRNTAKDESSGSTANPQNDLNTKTGTFAAGINLDLVYFPSKQLGVTASIANLEYNHFKTSSEPTHDHETGDNFNFNIVNNGLLLSVFFVFGGK